MTSDALEALGRSRYISLTTYRKNGTPVSTPVWVVSDGTLLYVWTKTDTWKVKRLRNDKRVVVTACDVRGRIAEGAVSAEGTATLLDESGMPKVRRLLSRKYKWQYWMVDYPALIVRLGKRPHTGIAVRLTQV
ncbi:PPOX class F420-dependent oxidoreductase [Streptomyces sp. TRM66268-LWL]|uniref:PPOX class F420-dependent oxidoreductase n=1 Tax=Streptomyces polyasparticus TaxID=2767826 RepID=A0ABR7SD84_9ACTN|nr:PPOX class F420-dependent oxidoreductase [Streptomyces polyasparticus]MBC9712705.1 PPOX class F420-dependent oxidoreductase [Streptomyces polyasparticus]